MVAPSFRQARNKNTDHHALAVENGRAGAALDGEEPGLHVRVVVIDGELHGLDAARVAGGGPEVSVVPHCEVGGGGAVFHDNETGFAGDIEGIRVDQRRDTATDPELTWKKKGRVLEHQLVIALWIELAP